MKKPLARNAPVYNLLPTLLCAALLATLSAPAVRADEAKELYKRLEQRWYITEVIAFHDANTLSNSYEQIVLDDIERETELVLDTDLESPEEPPLTEAEERQALFNADHPNPAGSKDSVSGGQAVDEIEFSTIGSDVGYALFEQNTLSTDEVITYNLQAYEEMLRALDRRWLNRNYLSMAEQAKRVNRGRGRSLLFHGAWLQAVPERSAPNPVAISSRREGGEPVVDTPELEGEIAVTVGKYLHVDADLAYYPTGQATPEATPSATRFGRQFNPATPEANRFTQQPPPSTTGSRARPVVELSSSRAANASEQREQTDPINSLAEPTLSEPTLSEPTIALKEPHLRMTQSRRMRSNQVHYIDHPGLGLLVKITQVPIPNLLQEQLRVAKQSE